jgi:hypothetical protein
MSWDWRAVYRRQHGPLPDDADDDDLAAWQRLGNPVPPAEPDTPVSALAEPEASLPVSPEVAPAAPPKGGRELQKARIAERNAAVIAAANEGVLAAELAVRFKLTLVLIHSILSQGRRAGTCTAHFRPGPIGPRKPRPARAGRDGKPKDEAPAAPIVDPEAEDRMIDLIKRRLGVTAIAALTGRPYREIIGTMDRLGLSHVPT